MFLTFRGNMKNNKPLHVYPIADLREHEIEGEQCWCDPMIEDDGNLIIHYSMDERESYEEGRKPH